MGFFFMGIEALKIKKKEKNSVIVRKKNGLESLTIRFCSSDLESGLYDYTSFQIERRRFDSQTMQPLCL